MFYWSPNDHMEAKNTFAVTMYVPYAKWRLNFERIFVTDFCSNNFAEISLVYLLHQ